MPSITITNTSPELDMDTVGQDVDLFRAVIGHVGAYPFLHQTRVFQRIRQGQECVLVAGTAAGKTLAVVVPLLQKIKMGSLKKVLFLYPTLALLEDQLATVNKVAAMAGLSERVGSICGGMSRHELLEQLNKDILIATPDAVYWFLEKNVKYSTLLIYALCHVDDVVVDEAHLLSGLMGYNLKMFLDRISNLRERFLQKDRVRTHILTATPTEVVSFLSSGEQIYGRSKVGDVSFEYECRVAMKDIDKWEAVLLEETERGFERMLLVVNSAASAHRVFHAHTVEGNIEGLQPFSMQFGQVELVQAVEEYSQMGIEISAIERMVMDQIGEHHIRLSRLPERAMVTLKLETVVEVGTYFETSEQSNFNNEMQQKWEEFVFLRFGDKQSFTSSVAEWKLWLNGWDSREQKVFSRLVVQVPNIHVHWAELLRYYKFPVFCHVLEKECHQLGVAFEDIFMRLLNKGRINTRYIRLLKGTDIPVVLYTGSMTKNARRGLIQAFQAKSIPRAILISTSAVEAGVDFEVDLLVTEGCTGSSFLQRFGRVGRRGGKLQRVRLVTSDASITGKMQESFAGRSECTREEFSKLMEECLPKRAYFSSSPYLDILHAHVTRRLGEVGRILQPHRQEVERPVLENGGFRYGLRSTLPQIELLDEGISRDPFQLLSVIPRPQLIVEDGSFAMAKAEVFFDDLIYKRWQHEVVIDQDQTFKNMRLLLFFYEGKLQCVNPEILRSCAVRGKSQFAYRYTHHCHLNNPKHLQMLLEKKQITGPILSYLKAVQEKPVLNCYILGVGDVYLAYGEGESLRLITDRNGRNLVMRNQMYLFVPNQGESGNQTKTNAENWRSYEQELFVLGESDYRKGPTIGDFALDRVAGACMELYRRLVGA